MGPTNSAAEIQRTIEAHCVPSLGALHSVDLPAADLSRWAIPGLQGSTLEAALSANAVVELAGPDAHVVIVRFDGGFQIQLEAVLRQLSKHAPDTSITVLAHSPSEPLPDLPPDADIVIALTSGDFCRQLAEAAAPRPAVAPSHCTAAPWFPDAGLSPEARIHRLNPAGPWTGEMRMAAELLDPAAAPWEPLAFREGWVHAEVVVTVLELAAERPGGLTRSNVLGVARALAVEHPVLEGGRLDGTNRIALSDRALLERWDAEEATWEVAATVHASVDGDDVVDTVADRAETCLPRPLGLLVATSGWDGEGDTLSAASRPTFVLDGLRWPNEADLDRFWVQVRSADGQFQSMRGAGTWDPDCPGRLTVDLLPWFMADVASRAGPYEISLRMSASDTLDTVPVVWPTHFKGLAPDAELQLTWVGSVHP